MSAGAEERKAAGLILALVIAGTLVRVIGSDDAPGGQIGYQAVAGERPHRDSVAAQAERVGRALGPGERVDVDRAPATELVRLPGIGAGLAARIVEQREVAGPFGSLEALSRISGIGPSVIERIRPHVSFSLRPRLANTREPPSRIRVNTADEETLTRLPGIGPSKARAIVADRKAHGPYRTLEDLGRVRGIGPATLEAIAPLVVIP